MNSNFSAHSSEIISEIDKTIKKIDDISVSKVIEKIISDKRIFVAGAGRTGLVMRSFAMRLMHLGFRVYLIGDITTPSIDEEDILLIGSGSGNTSSLINISKKAKEIGVNTILLTIDPSSIIGRLASIKTCIPAPSPKLETKNDYHSLQPMGSLFEQSLMIVLDTIIWMLMDKMEVDSKIMFKNHANLE
jgi:6-phospho-3-hexuloisomerase